MSTIVPFDVFLRETAAAQPDQYAEALDVGAQNAGITLEVARAEFARMKEYILAYYKGVQPVGSFLDANGQTIDCVPFEQQPTVRAALAEGHCVARSAPPPPRLGEEPAHGPHPEPIRQRQPVCPEGAVPIVRLTLDRLARHGTLENFFRKTPHP